MSANKILPTFSDIDPNTMPQVLSHLLKSNLDKIDLLTKNSHPNWDNVMRPLHEIDVAFERLWSPFSHINNVCNSDDIRASYNNCIVQLSQYSTQVGQNKALFNTIESIYRTEKNLSPPQIKSLERSLRDFKLSGVTLDNDKKQQFKLLSQKLAELTTKFSENVMDATDAWTFQTEDLNELAGLPEFAIESAKNTAMEQNHS